MIQQVVDNNISILIDVIGNEFNNTQYNSNPSLQESHQNELLNVNSIPIIGTIFILFDYIILYSTIFFMNNGDNDKK